MCFSLENVWKLVKDFIHLHSQRITLTIRVSFPRGQDYIDTTQI